MLSFLNRSNNQAKRVSTRDPLPSTGVAANASASFTRPANTTDYTAGDALAASTSAGAALEFDFGSDLAGATILLTAASLRIDVASVPSGMGAFKLQLYTSQPTGINDNAAYNLPSGDRDKHVGSVQLNQPEDLGDTIKSNNDSFTKQVTLASGSSKLWGIPVTDNNYTPGSGSVYTINLRGLRVA